ncbi:MAG: rhomboid family intramembrane serine protease [Chloroflexia bacterium]|nr:rhomboid family intramembrane serine protease [Chloroflexia bacterium]
MIHRTRRIASSLPWTDGSGRPWCGWARVPRMVPFVPSYLLVSWILFVPAAERRNGKYWIDEAAVDHLLFHVPDLSEDFPLALRSLATAPWLNHDSLQLIYVTALLLLFGVVFELREGTGRTVLLFFGTTFAAAVIAGFALHLVYPTLFDHRILENAWGRTWSGGSAGCFGLMGALAARARRPAPLLAFFVLWEMFIWWVNLRNYTSAFHLTALTVGFIAARFVLPPIRRVSDRGHRPGQDEAIP